MNEGVTTISYTLDEGLIEFGTAVDDGDFPRLVTPVSYLRELTRQPHAKGDIIARSLAARLARHKWRVC